FGSADRRRLEHHITGERCVGRIGRMVDPMKWIKRKLRRSGRIFNELGGRARLNVIKYLIAQIKATREGTELATQMVRGDITTEHARDEISEIEHRGDHE